MYVYVVWPLAPTSYPISGGASEDQQCWAENIINVTGTSLGSPASDR